MSAMVSDGIEVNKVVGMNSQLSRFPDETEVISNYKATYSGFQLRVWSAPSLALSQRGRVGSSFPPQKEG